MVCCYITFLASEVAVVIQRSLLAGLKNGTRNFVGDRPNQRMNQTRVAPVKGSNCARKSLAQFELCEHWLRADYLGRYNSGF